MAGGRRGAAAGRREERPDDARADRDDAGLERGQARARAGAAPQARQGLRADQMRQAGRNTPLSYPSSGPPVRLRSEGRAAISREAMAELLATTGGRRNPCNF